MQLQKPQVFWEECHPYNYSYMINIAYFQILLTALYYKSSAVFPKKGHLFEATEWKTYLS